MTTEGRHRLRLLAPPGVSRDGSSDERDEREARRERVDLGHWAVALVGRRRRSDVGRRVVHRRVRRRRCGHRALHVREREGPAGLALEHVLVARGLGRDVDRADSLVGAGHLDDAVGLVRHAILGGDGVRVVGRPARVD